MRRVSRRGLVTGLAVLLLLLVTASSATAGLRKDFSVFYDCPTSVPGVSACIVSNTTSGEFKLGSKTVTINKTITLQGGVSETTNQLVPAADGNTLSKTPLTVPGGLLGIEGLGGEVTATAELAKPVTLALQNLGTNAAALSLPLKVKLSNPALGGACYLGSSSEPVSLNLTTGTTSPPGPNKSITGSTGTAALHDHAKIIEFTGSSLVDNSFAAPGANGCGGILSLLIDPIVDLDSGVPASAGHNTAILNGSFVSATPRAIKAQAALPEVGRCVKVSGEKVGKETVYHGHYEAKDCVEENPFPPSEVYGRYEWLPGPGTASHFTGSAGKTTIETVNGRVIACSHASAVGAYTGTKTATATITLSGCKRGSDASSCQSAGAATGEIVTSTLTGQLGFIRDFYEGEHLNVSVGLDLSHAPTLLTAECAGEGVSVAGSVIAPVTKTDKMTGTLTFGFQSLGGHQAPEAFEEEPTDVLTSTSGSGAEQSGLSSKLKIANEEKLEIKAAAE